MRAKRSTWLYLLGFMLLAACSGTGTRQQTLVAFQAQMETDRAALAVTSTAEMEQLLFTLDYSEAEMTRVNNAQSRIISTLDQRGVQITLPTGLPTATLTNTPRPTNTGAATAAPGDEPTGDTVSPAPTPSSTPRATPTPTPVEVTPIQPTATETPTLVSRDDRLQDVVLATDVGEDDCATEVVESFSTEEDRLYVVARAVGVTSGTTLTSRWERVATGEELGSFDFTPDFDIDDACIWFFVTQEDFDFIPGRYQVTLEINGERAREPVVFNINAPVTPIPETSPTGTNAP